MSLGRRRAACWGALCLVALTPFAAAQAQLAPGMSGYSDAPTNATEDQYHFFIRELGACLARTKRAQSVAFMAAPIDTPEETRAFGALINRKGANACMSNMVRATIVRAQVRGSVAEGLYELHVASEPRQAPPRTLSAPATVRTIHQFADCYVASNYPAARALLGETRLGTKEESERVREMASGFGPCLPQGLKVRIAPTDVRMALAGALYRTTINRPMTAQGSD